MTQGRADQSTNGSRPRSGLYSAQQIRPYLDILEQRIRSLHKRSRTVRMSFTEHGFEQYVELRNMLSECKALIVIVETRLENARAEGEPVKKLEEQLVLLTTQLWETLLATALEFFRSVSRSARLPLGSRDVFMRELKTLHDARSLLNREPYSLRVEQETLENLDKAERILKEIIERAPGLLELD